MMPYNKSFSLRRRTLAAVALITGVAAGLLSCTNRDSEFGNNLIPSSQIMGTSIDSATVVHTYYSTLDSLITSGVTYQPYLGSFIDPLTGRVTFGAFTNLTPSGFPNSQYFGANPVVDSMTMNLMFSNFVGDTSKVYTIDIYEVQGHYFHPDSVVFSNIDMTPYLSALPVLSFDFKGNQSYFTVKFPIGFARKFMDNTQGEANVYYSDSAFQAAHNGLYFKLRTEPVDPSVDEGMVVMLNLSGTIAQLHYHNQSPGTRDKPQIQDMVTYLSDLAPDFLSFYTINYDYTYSDIAAGGVDPAFIGDTTADRSVCYVQGLAGLKGLLRVDSLDVVRIKNKAKALGYSKVVVHRAELQMSLINDGADEYGQSFKNLGIYYSYLEGRYLSEYDILMATVNPSYKATLGGGLSYSRGKYIFDITAYVQRMFVDSKVSQYTTELLPSPALINALSRSRIYGSASPKPPKLIITYSMVK